MLFGVVLFHFAFSIFLKSFNLFQLYFLINNIYMYTFIYLLKSSLIARWYPHTLMPKQGPRFTLSSFVFLHHHHRHQTHHWGLLNLPPKGFPNSFLLLYLEYRHTSFYWASLYCVSQVLHCLHTEGKILHQQKIMTCFVISAL